MKAYAFYCSKWQCYLPCNAKRFNDWWVHGTYDDPDTLKQGYPPRLFKTKSDAMRCLNEMGNGTLEWMRDNTQISLVEIEMTHNPIEAIDFAGIARKRKDSFWN